MKTGVTKRGLLVVACLGLGLGGAVSVFGADPAPTADPVPERVKSPRVELPRNIKTWKSAPRPSEAEEDEGVAPAKGSTLPPSTMDVLLDRMTDSVLEDPRFNGMPRDLMSKLVYGQLLLEEYGMSSSVPDPDDPDGEMVRLESDIDDFNKVAEALVDGLPGDPDICHTLAMRGLHQKRFHDKYRADYGQDELDEAEEEIDLYLDAAATGACAEYGITAGNLFDQGL